MTIADEERVGAPQPEEHRKTPRFEVELPTELDIAGTLSSARIVNLSLGGCLIRTDGPHELRVGQRLAVSFVVPAPIGELPLKATVEVRWVGEVDRESIGVQFVTGFRAREVYGLGEYLKRLP